MKDLDRHVDGWLIGVGVALLIGGGSLAYPYVHSRLAAPAPVATSAPTLERTVSGPEMDDDSVAVEPTEDATRPPAATSRPSPQPSPVLVSALVPERTAEALEPRHRDDPGAPPTRIVVPSLGVDAPAVPASWSRTQVEGRTQTVWEVPDAYAAGWHETSSRLGEYGNIVLNGHNTNHGEVFRDIYRLETGDEIILYSNEISRTYQVSRALILPEAGQPVAVRLENARYVMPTADERLTLVTCHPYGSLRNRLIVIAHPARNKPESEPPEES